MQEHEIELSVGDVLRVGDRILTVVDIEGLDVSLHVEDLFGQEVSPIDASRVTRPR